MSRGFLTTVALSCFAAMSFGQVTGLVSIPTADVIGHREVELGYSVAGMDHSISKEYGHGAYILAGGFDRFEIAGATDFLGGQAWGFKYVPYRSADDKIAIGVGAQNINGRQSDLFAMGRYNCGNANFHLGWTRDSDHRALFGVDYSCDRWTFGADYSSNADGATWVGAWYDLGQGFTANFSFGRPTTRSDGDQHAFMLANGTRF